MTTAAITTSQTKPVFEAKPKLKVWSQQIKQALHAAREKHRAWRLSGKPNDKNNNTIMGKKGIKKVSKTGNKNRNSNTKK